MGCFLTGLVSGKKFSIQLAAGSEDGSGRTPITGPIRLVAFSASGRHGTGEVILVNLYNGTKLICSPAQATGEFPRLGPHMP